MYADRFVFFLLASALQAQWTPEFSMKVKSVGEVTPSPDGNLVAWTETRAVMDGEKSEMNTQIFLARSGGSERLQLTRGEKSSNAIEFSPDGRFVYFASDRSGKRGFYRVPVDGGEAEHLSLDPAITPALYHLSPNGKWLAFTGTAARAAVEQAKKERRDFRVVDEDPAQQSLYLLPIAPDTDDKRTAKLLVSGPFSVGNFDWSPDNRSIAYESRPSPAPDVARKSDLGEVEIESGITRVIAATEAAESEPHYSPDGRYLAFVRSDESPGRLSPSRIVLISRTENKLRELRATPDEEPILLGWSQSSKQVYFVEPSRTKLVLYGMPVDGPPKPVFVPSGTQAPRLNATGTYAGVALQSPNEPAEAYYMDLSTMKPVRVSAANSSLVLPPMGASSIAQWKTKDGTEIEGLLTLPVNYRKGTKVPLILNIHGGPSGAFFESFIGAPGLYPIATFAAKGYAVLRANPRGSVGRGTKFRAANVNDWGGGDYQDLMAGVDHLIATGVADPDRLAVMGWSYGGYMTDWVITHTTRFKAAASGAGLSDLISMWGTNDIPSVLDDYFTGTPMEAPDRYLKMSPLYYVKNVTTPTLFLHGEVDPRVPTSQGYEMYNALKRRGVETNMVVYPRTQHGPQEPKFLLDIMQRHLDWVAKHVGN